MYTAEEQTEHRKQWVEALRSGKYQQGKGRLRNGDKFCCLGVACDISGLGQWIKDVYKDDEGIFHAHKGIAYRVDPISYTHVLPYSVANWLGVNTELADIYGDGKTSLSKANDDGYDFNEIADIIESDGIVLRSQ